MNETDQPIYQSMNSPSVIEHMPEDQAAAQLPSGQRREYAIRKAHNLPFSFYRDDRGNLSLSHRDDWSGLQGLG